MLTLFKINFDN